MAQPVVIKIDSQGTVTMLKTPITQAMFPGATDHRRASHVFPMNPIARLWFKALRVAFGDEGKVAAWTRFWGPSWQVDLSPLGGPTYKHFYSHAHAVEWEVEWLNKNFLAVKK